MIFDTLNNLPNYLGISPHLDTAIEYIMARDIATLPEGRTRVDGEAVTVEVRTLTPPKRGEGGLRLPGGLPDPADRPGRQRDV